MKEYYTNMSESLGHNEIVSNRKVGEVAASLINLLQRHETVAYVVGLRQGRTVKNWAENGTTPSDPLMEARLQIAESLALTVKDEQRPWVSSAWLIAGNPHLGEISPSAMIQSLTGTIEDKLVNERLQQAAEHFALLPE